MSGIQNSTVLRTCTPDTGEPIWTHMQSLAIVILSIGSAVFYGILHDQITARICVEYFTIGHPPVFGTENPTLLGVGWGIIATWWAGLLLGVPLAAAARAGRRPKRNVSTLYRPVMRLLAVMLMCAVVAGFLGWYLGSQAAVRLAGNMATAVPRDKHVPFIVALWAHSASYLTGAIGGCVLIVSVWRSRGPARVHIQ